MSTEVASPTKRRCGFLWARLRLIGVVMSGDSDGLERELDFVDAPLGLRARDVRIELLVRDSARFSCRTQNDAEGRSMFGRINLLTDGAQAEGLVTKAWFSDAPFNNGAVLAVGAARSPRPPRAARPRRRRRPGAARGVRGR